MAKKRKSKKPVEPIEAIKRLLIIQSLAIGVEVDDIANALGYDSSMISKIVSVRSIKGIQSQVIQRGKRNK